MPTFDSTTFKFRLEQDQDCPNPLTDCDGMPKVAYLSRSRYVLGSEAVDQERMDEIAKGIESGKLIGLPVYAYVHSGVALSTGPFSCPWDSGQSGFVYETKETILEWYGKKRMTKQLRVPSRPCFPMFRTPIRRQLFQYPNYWLLKSDLERGMLKEPLVVEYIRRFEKMNNLIPVAIEVRHVPLQ